MDPRKIALNLVDTTDALAAALDAHAEAADREVAAREALADAETLCVVSGLEGKNDLARKAEIADRTAGELGALRSAAREATFAANEVEKARVRHRAALALARLAAGADDR